MRVASHNADTDYKKNRDAYHVIMGSFEVIARSRWEDKHSKGRKAERISRSYFEVLIIGNRC